MTTMEEKNSELVKSFDHTFMCVRLRDVHGRHKLSILSCDYNMDENGVNRVSCDLCTPDGKVLYCGIKEELLEVLIEHLGMELIKKD